MSKELSLSLDDLEGEIWVPIEPVEHGILVSNYARIKSLPKPNRHNQYMGERVMKTSPQPNGYRRIHYMINGISYSHDIHVLVAKAFIPNPYNKPFVLHKKAISDGGSDCVDNLYWGDQKDNMQDRKREGKYKSCSEHLYRIHDLQKQKINQYDLNGTFIKTWPSAADVKKVLKIDDNGIRKCCRGIKKSCKGYQWKNYEGNTNNITPYNKRRVRK